MTMQVTEKDYQRCHEVFDRDHDRLKSELMDRLPERPVAVRPMPSRRWRYAAAAVIVFALGLVSIFNQQQPTVTIDNPDMADLLTPHAAWASAVDSASEVRSIQMIYSTPRADGAGSSVKLWWRKPHDFRMVFDNGLILAGDGRYTYTLKDGAQTLTINDYTGPGLEMFILGNLGVFSADYAADKEWITQEQQAVSVKDITYRGERCRQITVAGEDAYYEYILDQDASVIYQGTRYSTAEPGRVVSRMEVLKVDTEMPDSLFTLEAEAGVNVVDRRSHD